MHSWTRDTSPSLERLLSLEGKVALVTGGAGLLGSQISAGLAERGASVVVASRRLESCAAMAGDLRDAYGGRHHGLGLDVTLRESVQACIAAALEREGRIDILVNCSWTGAKNTWDTITEADWLLDIDVTLNGVFRVIQEACPALKASRGVILNIASMYGHVAPDHRLYDGQRYANPASYGAGKAGLIQLTRYLASFLSPHGIRVNALSPGPFPYESTQRENPAFIQRLAARTPLNRIGQPWEVKGAAVLLCSDAASYITGQNICVDGGWAVW
jgi:NAD(P)-dependent dehydrogenase (short-subunit alcohol dehydrogenase family)